jgi:hypothetical protein
METSLEWREPLAAAQHRWETKTVPFRRRFRFLWYGAGLCVTPPLLLVVWWLEPSSVWKTLMACCGQFGLLGFLITAFDSRKQKRLVVRSKGMDVFERLHPWKSIEHYAFRNHPDLAGIRELAWMPRQKRGLYYFALGEVTEERVREELRRYLQPQCEVEFSTLEKLAKRETLEELLRQRKEIIFLERFFALLYVLASALLVWRWHNPERVADDIRIVFFSIILGCLAIVIVKVFGGKHIQLNRKIRSIQQGEEQRAE